MSINFAMFSLAKDVIEEGAYLALFYSPFAFGILKNFLGIFTSSGKQKGSEGLLPSGAYIYPSLDVDYLITEVLGNREIIAVARNPHLFEKYEIPLLWLSKVEKENAVSPTHLEKILHWAVTTITNEHALIFDGVEYLILENGFEPVFRFLVNLKDQILLKNSVLVLVVDERALEEKHAFLLQREFKKIL
ncbi:DUF835 domain-containing protein [Thermococcus sp. 2319x1]|uniref:DUF835 domain-containing protein n=1 Tax=Thermococcus sp. 2319x1 TaxID=1674923 RepID=UPI000A53999C|nr:DUF835 domain-containing protein [Thermococcus sp. 2319x1]